MPLMLQTLYVILALVLAENVLQEPLMIVQLVLKVRDYIWIPMLILVSVIVQLVIMKLMELILLARNVIFVPLVRLTLILVRHALDLIIF